MSFKIAPLPFFPHEKVSYSIALGYKSMDITLDIAVLAISLVGIQAVLNCLICLPC